MFTALLQELPWAEALAIAEKAVKACQILLKRVEAREPKANPLLKVRGAYAKGDEVASDAAQAQL